MNNNGLVVCPDCLKNNIKNIMGSITPEGNFAILRGGRNYTTIQSEQLMAICTCGFGTYIIKNKQTITYTL